MKAVAARPQSVKGGSLAWSWIAFGGSVVGLGTTLMVCQLVAASYRRGLDADMVPAMGETPFYQVALIGLLVGLFGSPMIVLGWWLNRSWGRGGGAFAAFVAGPPTLLLLAFEAYWIVSAALEPPMNITPFPANAWDYPPNWIMLIGTAASYLFAALVYTTLAQAKRSSKVR